MATTTPFALGTPVRHARSNRDGETAEHCTATVGGRVVTFVWVVWSVGLPRVSSVYADDLTLRSTTIAETLSL
jgi:hypothetical protein